MADEVKTGGRDRLHLWFGLSYASWLTLPRVAMQDMPDEWQDRMAQLLEEFSDYFSEMDFGGTPSVHCKDAEGKFKPWAAWIGNYRYPDYNALNAARRRERTRYELIAEAHARVQHARGYGGEPAPMAVSETEMLALRECNGVYTPKGAGLPLLCGVPLMR